MPYTFDLTGKKAIITGGAGDIGFAIAREMHVQGAQIALVDISANMEQKCAELKAGGDAPVHGITANLRERKSLRDAFEACMEAMQGVDILVNAAGICRRGASSEEFSEKDWDDVLEINLTATFLFSQWRAGDAEKRLRTHYQFRVDEQFFRRPADTVLRGKQRRGFAYHQIALQRVGV
jgi:NAD(P)-dependent dehydrogenase (short-subunit alcohol dehydrogenase family)